jgi:hypothetical protein
MKMKNCNLSDKKKKLKKALVSALKVAFKEMVIIGDHYKEENLRYVVMSKISEVNCFGNFPNLDDKGPHLCFDNYYKYEGLKKDSELRPDIVSLIKTPKGTGYSVNSLLSVELKQKGKISGNSKNKGVRHIDLKDKINKLGSCIESDIIKSRIYLTKKDTFTFEISVVIHLVDKINPDEIVQLNRMLNRQRKELVESKGGTNKNLLFAWFNPSPSMKKPELIWLNQTNEIKLGGVE